MQLAASIAASLSFPWILTGHASEYGFTCNSPFNTCLDCSASFLGFTNSTGTSNEFDKDIAGIWSGGVMSRHTNDRVDVVARPQ
ncbi:hypothetical protein B0H14DRAFT_443532 [Mycena olivaceomarginata]|nr:hypothetical protein B0H14DRAFT_443532 [Mycena olivaceomarginata]